MLSRISRSLSVLSPYVQNKQKYAINVHRNQFVRLLNESPVFNVAKQVQDDSDLLFDLGGAKSTVQSEPNTKKSKKSKKTTDATDSNKSTESVLKKVNNKSKKEDIPKNKKERSFDQLKFEDKILKLTYVKLPFNHPSFQNLMLMLKSRRFRTKENLLLIEGRRITLEAIDAGLKLKYLFFSNIKQIEAIRDQIDKALLKNTQIIRVPHNDLSSWSTLTTCPGLIAVFEKPNDMENIWKNFKIINELKTVPITVICDQIREPNNLGSIIRTCAAIPCEKIVLLKGCADPWDIKALRGGCGAQFHVEIVGPIEWDQLEKHLPEINDVSVFIADHQSQQQDDLKVSIQDEDDNRRKRNLIHRAKPKVYTDVAFHNCKHIALVIGGETEGVSSHAIDFMKYISNEKNRMVTEEISETKSSVVQPDNAVVEIPLGNGIESLNASVATAILLFEMRKQLTQ